ncbi:MAG: hypothetical protein RIF44_04915, partial [Nitratireductor sp.]
MIDDVWALGVFGQAGRTALWHDLNVFLAGDTRRIYTFTLEEASRVEIVVNGRLARDGFGVDSLIGLDQWKGPSYEPLTLDPFASGDQEISFDSAVKSTAARFLE